MLLLQLLPLDILIIGYSIVGEVVYYQQSTWFMGSIMIFASVDPRGIPLATDSTLENQEHGRLNQI